MRKNEFTKEEIKRLEELIKLRVTSSRSDQKRIRQNMRAICFYGSDYNISDMTIDKFHSLIDQEQIKIVNDSSVTK